MKKATDKKKEKDDKKKKKEEKKEAKKDAKTTGLAKRPTESPRPVGNPASGSGTGSGSGSGSSISSVEGMPSNSELKEMFETLLTNLGIGEAQKEAMRKMPSKDKWVLIQQNKATPKFDTQTPDFYIQKMKEGTLSLKQLEELRVLLGGQPVEWVEKFLKMGGLTLLFDALARKQKSYKGGDDTEFINECARALKALMNSQPGLEAVITSESSIPCLGETLDFVTGRMKTVIVEVLSALCLLSPEAHQQTVKVMKAKPIGPQSKGETRFGELMSSLDTDNVDLKVTVMQLINAMLSTGDEDDHTEIKDTFKIDKVVETLRKGQMKATLEVQLDIYDQMMMDDLTHSESLIRERDDQLDLFAQLAMQVKDTPAYDVLTHILQHFMLVRKEGKQGKMSWEVIDKFIQMAASAEEQPTDVLLGQAVCKDFLQLINGSLDIESLAAAPQDVNAVLGNADLSADQKLQALVKKYSELSSESESLRAKISHLEKEASSGSTSTAPTPVVVVAAAGAPQEQSPEIKKILENAESTNQKLNQVMQELTTMREVKESLELKLKEAEKKVAELGSAAAAVPVEAVVVAPPPAAPPAPDAPAPPPAPGAPPPPPAPGAPPPPPAPGAPPPPPGPGGPPPPPPPGGGPPPPPGPGGPPPPPGAPSAPGGPAGRPKKAQPKLSRPDVKMRQFNWAKLPDPKTMDTVWAPGGASDENVKLDLDEIEQLFSLADKKVEKTAGAEEPAKKQAISVLDPRRGQNISIMLARFKMPYGDLRKAIEELDESVLTVDNLTALKQYIPQPDEIAALTETEDQNNLSAPDKYFLEISRISNLGPRLECMFTKGTFAKKAETINASVSVISQAINEIKNSKKFVRFLEVVLKVGNMINTGSFRGGAYGFKLDTLTKLTDMRSSSKELPTMLHFIAAKSEKDFPEVNELVKDFEALPLACRESLSQVVSDLAGVKKAVEFVGAQVKTPPATPDKFFTVMSEFYNKASQQVSMLDTKLKKTEEAFAKTAEYFGEQANTPAEQLFNTVWAAVQALERAKADIEKKKQAEVKAKEAEERRQKLREKTVTGKPATGPGAGGPDRNVMDNLIGQMHTGDAFAARRAAAKAPGAPPGAAPAGGQQMVANEAMAIFARMKQKREADGS